MYTKDKVEVYNTFTFTFTCTHTQTHTHTGCPHGTRILDTDAGYVYIYGGGCFKKIKKLYYIYTLSLQLLYTGLCLYTYRRCAESPLRIKTPS